MTAYPKMTAEERKAGIRRGDPGEYEELRPGD